MNPDAILGMLCGFFLGVTAAAMLLVLMLRDVDDDEDGEYDENNKAA